jgi:WD40 repeat protein
MTVRFSAKGEFFMIGMSEEVRMWDWQGNLLGVIASLRGITVKSCTISEDGSHVAALFSDGVARIWSAVERRRIMSFQVTGGGPIAFSDNGRRLLVANSAGSIEHYALDVADLYSAAAVRLVRGFDRDEMLRFAIREPVRLDPAAYR